MWKNKPGFFISLEGGEGSGKTTQAAFLINYLNEEGFQTIAAREPGGTEISEQIRNIILNPENAKMNPRTETLLFQAARAQIVEEVYRPSLERGYILIADRFFDSTIAYQGFAHGQNIDEIKKLINYATGDLTPDLTVFFDVDPKLGLSRRRGHGDVNRLDSMDIKFHEEVHNGYLEMVLEDPRRWKVVDANKSIDDVWKEFRKVVEDELVYSGFKEREHIGLERFG